MNWNKIISFSEQNAEIGFIESATDADTAYFNITGRIWSWSVEKGSSLRTAIEEAKNKGITKAKVYGSSEGGSVFATYEIANLLEEFEEVKIEVGALMVSAFTYLTSKFHTTIKNNTQGMIHMPLTSIQGNIKEVKSDLKLLENITSDYKKAYSQKTGKTVAEIEALWKDGDYWMNAQELKKEGFVDAIKGEKVAFTEKDIHALVACGAPVIPKKMKAKTPPKNTNTNKHKMDREQLIALYGLPTDATDEDIMQAAKQNKVDALKFEQIQEKNQQDEAASLEAKAEKLVEDAIKDKKILATQKEQYQKLAIADFESTEAILKSFAAPKKLSEEIDEETVGIEARAKWTLDDYLEKDPEAFEKLKEESPEVAEKLENEYFKNK